MDYTEKAREFFASDMKRYDDGKRLDIYALMSDFTNQIVKEEVEKATEAIKRESSARLGDLAISEQQTFNWKYVAEQCQDKIINLEEQLACIDLMRTGELTWSKKLNHFVEQQEQIQSLKADNEKLKFELKASDHENERLTKENEGLKNKIEAVVIDGEKVLIENVTTEKTHITRHDCLIDKLPYGSKELYELQSLAIVPPELGMRKEMYSVDPCLYSEIIHLWSLGIVTTGCCCGHNIGFAYIGVKEEFIPKMKLLGYETQFNPMRPNDGDSFKPKTLT